jgi:hypothetical protein
MRPRALATVVGRPGVRLIVLAALAVAGGGSATAQDAGHASTVWKSPEGKPLPFDNEEKVLDFLRTAEVVESTDIPVGITRPLRLILEKDGVRARAAFRYEEVDRRNVSIEGRHYRRFRDSCRFECAAYRLSRLLGLDKVPPTTDRKFQGRSGSVQIWVEGSLDERAGDFKPPRPLDWVRQTWDRDFFDNLILNVDRNSTNVVVDPSYRLWLIDHTRAFQPVPELLDPEGVTRVNRVMWARLKGLDEATLHGALGLYLDGEEMMCLLRRRELLIEHVDRLVAERGEGVFY